MPFIFSFYPAHSISPLDFRDFYCIISSFESYFSKFFNKKEMIF